MLYCGREGGEGIVDARPLGDNKICLLSLWLSSILLCFHDLGLQVQLPAWWSPNHYKICLLSLWLSSAVDFLWLT